MSWTCLWLTGPKPTGTDVWSTQCKLIHFTVYFIHRPIDKCAYLLSKPAVIVLSPPAAGIYTKAAMQKWVSYNSYATYWEYSIDQSASRSGAVSIIFKYKVEKYM